MRYALILAGGSGTRLWPMSTRELPKQLIPFIGGESLLEIAYERLESLVPVERRFICAGVSHREVILDTIDGLSDCRFIGEPMGRDTLSALALSSAVIANRDEDAVIAVFTADHIIEPRGEFLRIVNQAFAIVEDTPATLMTFGISPTHAATGYGYLELGEHFEAGSSVVRRFREKPDSKTAETYLKAGAERYLWNSGMFVWKAKVFLDAVSRYEPEVYRGVMGIADAWGDNDRQRILEEEYPKLKKISVDFAVMERASTDAQLTVAALPMPLSWLDVGSWSAFGETLEQDPSGNATNGTLHCMDSTGVLSVSDDPNHLIATIGCEDMMIIHTGNATLVCPKAAAEKIKELHRRIGETLGEGYL